MLVVDSVPPHLQKGFSMLRSKLASLLMVGLLALFAVACGAEDDTGGGGGTGGGTTGTEAGSEEPSDRESEDAQPSGDVTEDVTETSS